MTSNDRYYDISEQAHILSKRVTRD